MIRLTVAVECDECGHRSYQRVAKGRRPSGVAAAARARLSRIGWRRDGDTDTCAACGGAE